MVVMGLRLWGVWSYGGCYTKVRSQGGVLSRVNDQLCAAAQAKWAMCITHSAASSAEAAGECCTEAGASRRLLLLLAGTGPPLCHCRLGRSSCSSSACGR